MFSGGLTSAAGWKQSFYSEGVYHLANLNSHNMTNHIAHQINTKQRESFKIAKQTASPIENYFIQK